MKIAITGKGGVGKTTLSAILSHLFSKGGKRVIAVDADPDANLGAALGIEREDIDKIRPIAEMTGLGRKNVGVRIVRIKRQLREWLTSSPAAVTGRGRAS